MDAGTPHISTPPDLDDEGGKGIVRIASVAALGGLLLQWAHTSWWSRRLQRLASMAREHMISDVTRVLYTEKNDELAAIELMLRMRKAELRAIVGRSGDTSDAILQAAEADVANIQSITQNLEQQQAETEQLATAIDEMSRSIHEVAHNAASTSDLVATVMGNANEGRQSVDQTISAVNELHDELTETTRIM